MTDEDKAPYVAQAQATRLKWEKELQIYKHELKIGVRPPVHSQSVTHVNIQKTGEEASCRITDLTEAGEEAIDDYCAEIPNSVAEKKQKLDRDAEKVTQRSNPTPDTEPNTASTARYP